MPGVGGQDKLPRWRLSHKGAVLTITGLVVCLAGFLGAQDGTGDVARGWGFLAGAGFTLIFLGLIKVWIDRQIDLAGHDSGGARRRERLQAERASRLWTLPLLAVVMMGFALQPASEVLGGGVGMGAYFWLGMLALYGWTITMITMGWDGDSRKNRRFLEDELTRVLRARALTTAFIVLMAGVTVALALGLLARPLLAVVALPFVLAAAGATAGIRFAWLDRQAGKDG